MRFFIFAILLAFPFLEIAVLIELCQRYGWWVLVYLVIIGYLGLKLIRSEKDLIAARMFQQMSAGGNPVSALLSTARNMFAGVLLLIPGVISDALAVILLLIPTKNPGLGKSGQNNGTYYQTSANDEVIEGEFTEVKETKAADNVVHLPRKD
ncbi:MAG TPA: FxsA family protein [Methylophilus sp.]|nr:FxsA family protein [Methylophilus sp.]